MKAVITSEDNESNENGKLKLRLVAEGANDRTLMLMLSRQYPAINLSTNDSISVPILCQEMLCSLSNEDSYINYPLLCSGVNIEEGATALITSSPWTGKFIDGKLPVTVTIEDVESWRIIEFTIDGRPASLTNPILFPGSVARMKVERLHGTSEGALRVSIKSKSIASVLDLSDTEIANWTTSRPGDNRGPHPDRRVEQGTRMALEIQRRRLQDRQHKAIANQDRQR